MQFFNNKFRIDSTRLPDWDYATNGIYFITICTYAKEHFFGEIETDILKMSSIGKITKKFLIEIPNHFEYAAIDAYVIMPNHIHILLRINNKKSFAEILQNNIHRKGTQDKDIFIDVRKTLQCNVSTNNKNEFMSHISPKKGSVSTIIRSYKSAVSKEVRKIDPDFSWQERFHDHIVRNEESYQKIKHYILNNPKNWYNDKFY